MREGELLNVNICHPPRLKSVHQWCNWTQVGGPRGAGAGLWRWGERGNDRADLIWMVQLVLAMEPSWLARPWSAAQVLSVLKSLSNLTEVAGSSSDLSHLLTSARDLSQTVETYISASLQWWKICFISLWYGGMCSPGMCSGKGNLRGKGLNGSAQFCHACRRKVLASRKASELGTIYCS